MNLPPVPGQDTVYVWIGRGIGTRPVPAGRLLRQAAAGVLGCPEADLVVSHRPGGAPLVERGTGLGRVTVPASVSRHGGVTVVAVRADGPVGVDVERHRCLPALGLARRWYDPSEVAWLAARPEAGRDRDFLRLWTAKEAVGKALGVGLRAGGSRRRMPVTDTGRLRPVPDVAGMWVGHLDSSGALVLAVAVVGGEAEVVVVEEA
ncbi:4'-phosphopantetheinyl transferase family protein [Salinispora arenicola]|uniref:4'-phosphopantetheinyl transferase family protein n=1 Tax=Salinispora arenicola TaxID=168697 RepID=UPI0003A34E69|nr:4'-phosphopantetheinyl transferase family protein [Salinispora arenicola]